MATQLDELVVKISGDVAELKSAMLEAAAVTKVNSQKMDAALDKFSKNSAGSLNFASAAFASFVGNLASSAFANAIAGIKNAFSAGVQSARDFNNAIGEVNSILPANQKLTKQNELALISLSSQYASTPQKQAKAFYQIVSSGITDTVAATKLLDQANRAAVAGVTDVETAIVGLTNVTAVFSSEGVDAARASDILFTSVREGKTNFELLANNIGKVAPIAKAAGVSFEELTAVFTTITKSGTSTEITFTNLKAAIQAIAAPSAEIQKRAESMGFSLGEAGIQSQGFVGTLKKLAEATGGSLAELQKFIPSIEGATAVAALSSVGFEELNRIFGQVKNSTGATSAAFAELEKTADFQLSALEQEIANIIPAMLSLADGPIAELVANFRKSLPDAVLIATDVLIGIVEVFRFIRDAVDGFNTSIEQSQVRLRAWGDIAGAILSGEFSKVPEIFNKGEKALAELDNRLLDNIANNGLKEMRDNLLEIRAEFERGLNTETLMSTEQILTANAAATENLKNKATDASKEMQELGKKIRDAIPEDTLTAQSEFLQAQLDARLISYEDYAAELLELESQRYESERDLLQQALDAKQITLDEYNQAESNLSKKAAAEFMKIEQDKTKFLATEQRARIQGLQSTLGQIAQLQDANNKTLATIGKAAAISQATISGIVAVQEALKVGTGLGGPPLGFAFAALVGAATAANVAKIAGVPLQSGIDEVPGPFNVDRFPAVLAGGERVVPAETNQDLKRFLENQNSGGGGQTVNINVSVEGVAFGDEGAAQLIERINEGIEQGVGRLRFSV